MNDELTRQLRLMRDAGTMAVMSARFLGGQITDAEWLYILNDIARRHSPEHGQPQKEKDQ